MSSYLLQQMITMWPNLLVPLQGLNEVNPAAAELEESNALALAIVPPGKKSHAAASYYFQLLLAVSWIQQPLTLLPNLCKTISFSIAQVVATYMLVQAVASVT